MLLIFIGKIGYTSCEAFESTLNPIRQVFNLSKYVLVLENAIISVVHTGVTVCTLFKLFKFNLSSPHTNKYSHDIIYRSSSSSCLLSLVTSFNILI